jgi:hypothetical protein
MDFSKNSHVKDQLLIRATVWYAGTDAIQEGEGLCYNTDYGTAANADGRRSAFVERPSASNNKAFAGVAARSYTAKSGGQFVEINQPGSKGVNIALGADTTIDTGFLNFTAGTGSEAGRFVKAGYRGRGAAYIRQTVTALIESSLTGAWSLDTDGVTLTVVATAGLAAGDTVVLLGGEIEDGGASIVPGKYTIASVTNATVLVLSSSAITGTAGAAVTCTGYAYTGNPVAQADLLDGEESGGVEFLSPPNAGVVGLSYMTGGVSYICGGVTLAADVDVTFAQGTYPGEKKAFICLGTMTTSDVTIDLATNGIQIDGSTALAEVNAIDAAADAAYLEFKGARWFAADLAGGATQA